MKKILFLLHSLSFLPILGMDNPIAPTENEYKVFKVVQRIRQIAQESREEIKRTVKFSDDREISQSPPNIHNGRIQRGLLLEMEYFPETMETPWGRISIMRQTSQHSSYCASIAASQLFFERIKANIAEFVGWSKKYHEVLGPITQGTETALRLIPKTSLCSYIGTRKLIVPQKCGTFTLYRVMQADSDKVPESHLYNYTERARDPETIIAAWNMMEERYQREHRYY